MIHEVSGDILLTGAQVIAHGVAANDPMNQGLALSLHKAYPAMHKDFHHWCNAQHPTPGSAWMWGTTDGKRIVNLLTQEGGYGHGAKPGRATTKQVNDALRALVKMAGEEGFSSIALPRLATGIGGLSWADVSPIIQSRLADLDIPIYLYVEYHAGQRATEPAA